MSKHHHFLFLTIGFTTGVAWAVDPTPVEGKLWKYEVRPDWDSVTNSTSDFYIPADTGWIVQGEEDMAKLNGWLKASSATRRFYGKNANSALILDNTTTWFAKETGPYGAHINIVKRGTSRLSNKTGGHFGQSYVDWLIEEGVFVEDNNYFNHPGWGNKVIVSAGATFEKNLSQPNSTTEIILAGTGYNNQGALVANVCNGNGFLSRVTLTNDATIALNKDGTFFDRYIKVAAPGYYDSAMDPAALRLNGHTLTLAGTAASIGFRKVNVTSDGGDGTIELAALATGGTRTLTFADAVNIPANVTVVTKDDAVIQFNEGTLANALDATIRAEGDLTFKVNENMASDYSIWSGPVQIAADQNVILSPGGASRCVTLAGVISGSGGLSVGTASAQAAGVVRILSANTYAGNTLLNTSGKVFVGMPTSVPDLTKLTRTAGGLSVAPSYDAQGKLTFGVEDVLALAQNQGLTTVSIDTTAITNVADLSFTSATVATYFPTAMPTWDSYGTGAGYLVDGVNPLDLNVQGGVVRVTGENTINLGRDGETYAGRVTGTSSTSCGTVVFDGAKDVVQDDRPFRVGNTGSSGYPRVIVTNSTLRSTLTHSGTDAGVNEKGAFFVGCKTDGILEVLDGAVVSNKLVVGGGDGSANGSGKGAVYQRGGLVQPITHIPAGNDVSSASIGGAGVGYYALEGGVLQPTAFLQVGIYKKGVFLQTGGEVLCKGLYLSSWLGDGVYTVLNGTTRFTGNGASGQLKCIGANTGTVTITVQGENAVFDSVGALYNRTYCFVYGFGATQTTVPYFRVNLNDGGTYKVGGFFCGKDVSQFAESYPYLVNFNGGILYASGATDKPFKWTSSDAKAQSAPNVVVYEKGARFQVAAGKSVTTAPCPIEAHKTGGIVSIALPADAPTASHVAPIVEILSSATGRGATAMALVDSHTLTITNILVTSRGWGYTPETTTVRLRTDPNSGILYTFPTDAVTTADNEIGGLTMEGPGTLTIGAGTNQWEKWTKVLGGTLKIDAGLEGAMPNDTELTLANGGVMDFNGVTATVTKVIYAAGGGQILNAADITGVDNFELALTTDEIAAGQEIALTGDFNLTGKTLVIEGDVTSLDSDAHYTLAQATGTLSGLPTVSPELPTEWAVRIRGNKLILSRPRGLSVIIH